METDRNGRAISRPPGGAMAWLPLATVVTGCLVGCLLPVVAYAQAMAILFGFGFTQRRWAPLLIAVPTAVWLWPGGLLNRGGATPAGWLADTALLLACSSFSL
jgi:hypothetical protein